MSKNTAAALSGKERHVTLAAITAANNPSYNTHSFNVKQYFRNILHF